MNLLTELKRRNVIRMGLLYVVSCWLILQVGDVLFELLGVPDWSLKLLFGILLLGLPFALFFSWVYELTPEGLKKESEVDRAQSMTPQTGKRLDRLIIAVMGLVIVALLVERFVSFGPTQGGFEGDRAAESTGETPSGASEGDRATSWSVPANGATEAEPSGEATSWSVPGESTSDENSIAVLPFENMSVDAANEFFADGISEEILNLLAGVDALEVASRTSSFAFKGKDTSIPQIADSLNVRYVLEGSVRKAGDQVRITAQLIDAQTDRHLWSDTFDRTLEDIFAVQDEIAGAIGKALQVQLLGDSGETVRIEDVDPGAYEKFLEARFLMRKRNPDALRRAEEMLDSVVAAEPGFARGLALLGEVKLLALRQHGDEARAEAQRLAEKALSINPRLATAFMIIGQNAGVDGDRVTEYRSLMRAIELDPTEPRPHHWLAMALAGAGYLERARRHIDEAVRLEPDNANAHGWKSAVLAAQGHLDNAVEEALAQASLGNPMGHVQAGIYHLPVDRELARASFVRAREAGFESSLLIEGLEHIANDRATKDDLGAKVEQVGNLRGVLFYGLLMTGHNDLFLHFARENPRQGTGPLIWYPPLAEMRQSPRFMELVVDAGVTELWGEIGPPPDCRAEGDTFICGLTGAAQ